MTYVYDLLVNFNKEMYDFYDWDKSDVFTHIRKVPLFKVSTNTLVDFMFKKVKVDENFLLIVKNKTEVFSIRNIERLEYSFIISDGECSVIVLLNKSGVVSKKSKFLILEEMEISNISSGVKCTNVGYKVLDNKITTSDLVRKDKVIRNNILRDLYLIKEDEVRLKYLYYELFNIECESEVYDKLVCSINEGDIVDYNEILRVLSMICVKKIV